MYLKRLYVENSGPLKKLDVAMPFDEAGAPTPLVLVGGNGSGKTNFLSIIADAMYECAGNYFQDFGKTTQQGRSWFRVIGGGTITYNEQGMCAILKFQEGADVHMYHEKGGVLQAAALTPRLPEELRDGVEWPDEGPVKKFGGTAEQAQHIFQTGAYTYFPSSRAESPHWLNRETVPDSMPDIGLRLSNRLGKPIFVERGIDKLRQWLVGVLVDGRADITVTVANNQAQLQVVGDPLDAIKGKGLWNEVSQILRLILNDSGARLGWTGRNASGVGFVRGDGAVLPLAALSAGQATLLNLFGTLLRYGDGTVEGTVRAANVVGICVVDEIDAHMHIDLQHRALPKLVRMFPKVQFIVSSHSPLFVLGMANEFGQNVTIVEMPTGAVLQAESYSEFERAFEVLQQTEAFSKRVLELTKGEGTTKLLVLLEGETDPKYFEAAAKALRRDALLDSVRFQWVGLKDKDGNARNTGASALDAAVRFFEANPDLMGSPTLVLYDCDTAKPSRDLEKLYVRSIRQNAGNTLVTVGIENLLPQKVFTQDMYLQIKKRLPTGGESVIPQLQKVKLCDHLCSSGATAEFVHFGPVLDDIEAVAKAAQTAI